MNRQPWVLLSLLLLSLPLVFMIFMFASAGFKWSSLAYISTLLWLASTIVCLAQGLFLFKRRPDLAFGFVTIGFFYLVLFKRLLMPVYA